MPSASRLRHRSRLEELAVAAAPPPEAAAVTRKVAGAPFGPPKLRSLLVDSHRYFPAAEGSASRAQMARAARKAKAVVALSGGAATAAVAEDGPKAPPKARKPGQMEDDPSRGEAYQALRGRTDSEWAMLSRLEHELHVEEVAQTRVTKQQLIENQRAALDAQMEGVELNKRHAEAEKRAENDTLLANIAIFKEEMAHLREKEAVHIEEMKRERKEQLEGAQNRKTMEKYVRRQEEKADLAKAKMALAEEDRRKLAKKEQQRAEMLLTRAANQKDLDRKKALKAAEREEAERLNREYIAMLDKQDADRAAALEKMYAASHARAEKAGESAAEASAAREREANERELKLYQEREAQFLRDMEEKREMKAAATAELLETLAMQKAQKEERARREKEEMRAFFATVKQKDDRAKENDRAREAYRRAVNVENRLAIEEQIKEKKVLALSEDGMADVEKRLNNLLLVGAMQRGS